MKTVIGFIAAMTWLLLQLISGRVWRVFFWAMPDVAVDSLRRIIMPATLELMADDEDKL